MNSMKRIYLNDQTSIPVIGFGTWQLPNEEVRKPLETALSVGYRHIDTAAAYDNHEVIGEGVEAEPIKKGGAIYLPPSYGGMI